MALSTTSSYVCRPKATTRIRMAGLKHLSKRLAFISSSAITLLAKRDRAVNFVAYWKTVSLP